MIFPPITQAITTADFVPVRLPANCSCRSFSLWTEDKTSYEISNLANGSNAVIVPDGFPLGLTIGHAKSAAGTIICYAKGTSSTNLVGLVTR